MSGEARSPLEQERAPLEATLRRLERKLGVLDAALATRDADYRDVKSYMVDNRGDLDPGEMYQNDLFLRDIDAACAHTARERERLVAMRSAPYFARLDFRPDGAPASQPHYIGRATLQDADGTAVVDWRSPLGGVYYETELGDVAYEAPVGTISGVLDRRRQIKIENGRLRFAFDTADAVRDSILLEETARTTDAHMRAIIATIQREQNAIIRGEADRTLIVQGVAGSGKTSIALHRVAYLLFRQRGQLRAEHITVLSPHGLFAEYVSQVLPELGEEPVASLDLVALAGRLLRPHGLRHCDPVDPVEPGDDDVRRHAAAKGTLSFHRWLDAALDEAVATCFEPRGEVVKGCRLDAADLERMYARLAPLPVRSRLRAMADRLATLDREARPWATTYPRPAEIARVLGTMLTDTSARALYRRLLSRPDSPAAVHAPAARTLEWADVYPFLLVASRFDGLEVDEQTRHLVVDEMQDCSPTQYAVLRRVFPCAMTVLGDVDQALGHTERYTLSDLAGLFDEPQVVQLDRSYRSTAEIMAFASRFRGRPLSTIDRHGDVPAVVRCAGPAEEIGWIAGEVRRFRARGRGRLAVVTRSRATARELHRALCARFDGVALGSDDPRGVLERDVVVLPVVLAKGLEFDEVIVAHASADEYGSEADRLLLYIACTRALHRLTVTHSGSPSPHLPVAGDPSPHGGGVLTAALPG